MSHLLTRLAGRALGVTSTVEPVRSPVFTGESPGYGEPAESGVLVGTGAQHDTDTPGFVYGDIVRTLQTPPTQTPGATGRLSDAVAGQEGDVPTTPVHPLGSRVKDAMPAPEEDALSTPVAYGQQQGHDITVSSTLVGTRTDGVANKLDAQPEEDVESGFHTTALSPVTSHSSHTINSHSSVHPLADGQGSEVVDIPAERQTSFAQTFPDALLRPRVSPAPSFPAQQVAIENRPRERSETHLSQPTIQVTIGRIDVRAVTAPSPPAVPRARKKPSPSLSLDDYLKQRSGGQR